MTTPIRFAQDLPDDHELRLCGDLGDGLRALELGVSDQQNSLAVAATGAKAIAVDPDRARIEGLRSAADRHEVTVECHITELADLGFTTSGVIDAVIANHTLTAVDDLGRVLRQVHRVMKSSRPLVIAVPHPFAAIHQARQSGSNALPYGSAGRTIGDWHIQLGRANFRVDQILELGVNDANPVPTTLILRATKEGD